MAGTETSLTDLARAGFASLDSAATGLTTITELTGVDAGVLLPYFSRAADPDQVLALLLRMLRSTAEPITSILRSVNDSRRLIRVLGASAGLGEFFLRNPEELRCLERPLARFPDETELSQSLLASVGSVDGFAALTGDPARNALRVRYRRHLAQIVSLDLAQPDPLAAIEMVTATLAALAAAALEASLAVARSELVHARVMIPRSEISDVRLAIIGMGKAGAAELNYVSDVDVIFVTECAAGSELDTTRVVQIASRLAVLAMRGIDEVAGEPPLWEVDANLRPEGRDGAMVRTLESHLSYYDRWAKPWEFQALLKARPLAGDRELGQRYVDELAPRVWSVASREGFVDSVQRMRQRVTEHIPADEVDVQLKLGPGGLRDIEFTVQLLQLVHGQSDPGIRQRGTLEALRALADNGYIGRQEAADFAQDYRFLRLLEHRVQLQHLRRTHLMPRHEVELRRLARATGIADTADEISQQWAQVKGAVRTLHERLFYRPLLAAVALLPDGEQVLSSAQAEARLAAIGFVDSKGALAHIAALTQGVSRRATIQRHLLPVLLGWFAEGADPDHGLLAFRRLSESLGDSNWYLRMLRDSSLAAHRLTQVLSGSRFVSDLLEHTPAAVAWLQSDEELRPRSWDVLNEETVATVNRHQDPEQAALALRTARRREVLRIAIASIVGLVTIDELGPALSDITTALLRGALRMIRRDGGPWPEFAIIAMGRYGGAELGFGSDVDVIYVYRPIAGMSGEIAQQRAEQIVLELGRLTVDELLPFELDNGLRPEGKNGAIVRSLSSYRAYYQRWSLTWEAQALLRARGVVGDLALVQAFTSLADEIRYPEQIGAQEVREIKRIKARIEAERLPQGADPSRHLKLGRGSLSDVEWLVQLWQLQNARRHPSLQTPSTLTALDAAVAAALVTQSDAARLRDAWIFASRARSAMTLWSSRTTDVLPHDRQHLEGVARLMEYPPGSATRLEEDYLGITRRARAVFERRFYNA